MFWLLNFVKKSKLLESYYRFRVVICFENVTRLFNLIFFSVGFSTISVRYKDHSQRLHLKFFMFTNLNCWTVGGCWRTVCKFMIPLDNKLIHSFIQSFIRSFRHYLARIASSIRMNFYQSLILSWTLLTIRPRIRSLISILYILLTNIGTVD